MYRTKGVAPRTPFMKNGTLEKAELTLFILVCTCNISFSLSLIVLVPKVELPSKTAKLFFVSYYIISNSSFVVLSEVAAVVVV